jgi:hypothetical protein
MTTKQRYEEMFVTVPSHALDDPNHETAIEDMNGYIERMGGTTHTPNVCGGASYSWTVPTHWTFRFYERFRSFGLHARVRPDSFWFGVLADEDLERFGREKFKNLYAGLV